MKTEMSSDRSRRKADGRPLSAGFKLGAIALVFLIIGYQTALLVYRASVSAILSRKAVPDTVYVERLVPYYPAAGSPDSARSSAAAPASAPSSAPSSARGASYGKSAGRSSGGSAEAAIIRHFSPRTVESFRFDPNTASVEDLQRLGFSGKQAASIDKYRKSGGRFRRKEDFARSFVVADSVFRRLEPFIDIPKIDLNLADSAAFDSLPGIGPYYASKMVSYRAELGGYSYPEQLMDIWKFDAEKFAALEDLICIETPFRFPLWSLGADSLALHPYLDARAARSIVRFRENSPREDWTVAALEAAGIISPETAGKLSPCVE